MKRILCAVCFSLLAWQSRAGEVDDNLKKFETALQKNAAEQVKQEGEKSPAPIMTDVVAPRIKALIADNNLKAAIELLQNLNNRTLSEANAMPLSEETKKSTSDLLAALVKAQEDREKAAATEVENVLKKATDAVKAANAPTDLDGILTQLNQIKNQPPENRRYDEPFQTNRRKIDGAYRFVSAWQDYLTERAQRNQNQVRQTIRRLSDMEVLLLPRSEILAKGQETFPPDESVAKDQQRADEAADQLIAKAKSLDDVGRVIGELRALGDAQRMGNVGSGNFHPYIEALEDIDKSYHDFQAGMPVNTNIFSNNRRIPPSVLPMRNQLLFLVLPRYINAPADVKPKPGEGVAEFVNRVVQDSKATGNVELALRARKVLRKMEHTASISKNENLVLHTIQAAQNQEAAEQWEMAVVSYQSTLKIGSDIVPVKWIGGKLSEIKKAHPAEYQKGMEATIKLPAPAPFSDETTAAPDGDK